MTELNRTFAPTLRSATRTTGLAAAGGFAGALVLSVLAAFVPHEIATIFAGLGTFVLFVAFVVFLVFEAMVFTDLKGRTKYGAALAVGGWFIPFGNFVLPALTLHDAVRALNGGKGGGVVWLWWLTYLAYVFIGVSHQVFVEVINLNMELNVTLTEGAAWVFPAFFWVKTLAKIVAFSGLSAIVVRMANRGAAPPVTSNVSVHA